jgi:excisionase family DNA binding protein
MTARLATGFASLVTSGEALPVVSYVGPLPSAGRGSTGRVGLDRPSARLWTVTRLGTPGWSLVAATLRLARGAHPHDVEEHPMNKAREEDPKGVAEYGLESRDRKHGQPLGALLRPSDVARLLACSSKTVYAWAASGYLPSVRLGRLVRFKAGDVSEFVEAHAGNPRTPER